CPCCITGHRLAVFQENRRHRRGHATFCRGLFIMPRHKSPLPGPPGLPFAGLRVKSDLFKMALVLGSLSWIGPFAIDMYLPAMPAIAEDLNASVSAAQGTLMAYFISFGISQLVYGPVSDVLGRKPPLYFGLAVFAL